jgi:hypothetical protein
MVSVAVAGNALTDVGLMLQLPAPYVVGQLRVTVPVNPSCAAIEIDPVVPVLPALTTGNAVGSVKTKSGLEVTFIVNDVARVEGAPVVVACSVTG